MLGLLGSAISSDTSTVITLKFPFSLGFYGKRQLQLVLNTKIIDDSQFINLSPAGLKRFINNMNKNIIQNQIIQIQNIYKRINMSELAQYYNSLLIEKKYKNKAELSRSLGVSRAWITKVMNLLEMKEE